MNSRPALAALAALMSLAMPPEARAQAEADNNPLDSGLTQQVRQIALEGGRAGAAGAPRVEVGIGKLDPRLHLAPCQHVDAYVPEGLRLWGKSRIGLRCTQGSVKWNVYLPVTVQVFGTALVARNRLAAGTVLGADDLTLAEVDLAEDNAAAVARLELAVGHALTRPLEPGQSLRTSHLKPRQWFNAGDTVTVSAVGDGFRVSGEGQALGNGIEGQSVRVRTEGGRVISGQPVGDRRVDMPL